MDGWMIVMLCCSSSSNICYGCCVVVCLESCFDFCVCKKKMSKYERKRKWCPQALPVNVTVASSSRKTKDRTCYQNLSGGTSFANRNIPVPSYKPSAVFTITFSLSRSSQSSMRTFSQAGRSRPRTNTGQITVLSVSAVNDSEWLRKKNKKTK